MQKNLDIQSLTLTSNLGKWNVCLIQAYRRTLLILSCKFALRQWTAYELFHELLNYSLTDRLTPLLRWGA